MLKGNNISRDTQGERIERLTLLSANIADHAVDIGVAGARLTAAQTSGADYLDAVAEAGVQDGQMDEAFETFHQCETALAKLYSASKAHLLDIIWELDKPDDFIEAYALGGASPYRYDGLLAKIATWEKNHDILVVALDERVLAPAAMANLVAKRYEMLALRNAAYGEKHESSEAYRALHELFDAQTKLLNFIYSSACLAWGDDDSRLRLLGFVPSSEVWTPGDPEPGVATFPDVPTGVEIKLIKLGDNEFFVISADEYTGNTGFDVRVAWGEIGGAVAKMPGEDTMTNVPLAIQYPGEVMHGMTICVWVRARNGEDVSDWADVAGLDVP